MTANGPAVVSGRRSDDIDVQKATADDFATVLGWLEREYAEDDGEGFWCC